MAQTKTNILQELSYVGNVDSYAELRDEIIISGDIIGDKTNLYNVVSIVERCSLEDAKIKAKNYLHVSDISTKYLSYQYYDENPSYNKGSNSD